MGSLRTRMRILVIGACLIGLFSLIGSGYSLTELEEIASSEIIDNLVPAISAAAGMELASHYATTKTQEELETLVVSGETTGIRTAARLALSILYADKTAVELTALATGDIDPAIREAAAVPLQNFLVTMTVEDLETTAISGATHEIRMAAADMYYLKIRGDLSAEKLEAEAVVNDSAELAYMAGKYLAGFYLSFNPKSMGELRNLAKHGESEGLRVAGATALTSLLIESDLTAADLELTLRAIGGDYPELQEAYRDALAVRYAA